MSESPEARARRTAHALLFPERYDGTSQHDRIAAELLRLEGEAEALRREVEERRKEEDECKRHCVDLYRFRDERDAARAEAEALRRERDRESREWSGEVLRLTNERNEARSAMVRAEHEAVVMLDERDAALRSNAELRARIDEAAKGDSARVRAMRSNLRRLDSDGLSQSNAEHLLSVLDACRASNAELRGMLEDGRVAWFRGDGDMHAFWKREDVLRACAAGGGTDV